MSLAIMSNGTLLKRSTDGGTSYTTVPEVARVNSPDIRTDLQDVTTHDSTGGFREFMPGLKDGDVVNAELNVVHNNAVHVGLRTDQQSATLRKYGILFPGGSGADEDAEKFDSYVQSFPWQANVGEVLRSTLALKVTGPITWATSLP